MMDANKKSYSALRNTIKHTNCDRLASS